MGVPGHRPPTGGGGGGSPEGPPGIPAAHRHDPPPPPHAVVHSYLNATTGSRRAARTAGYTPKITPTLAPRPSATTTDQAVTRAGRGDTALTSSASAVPASRPSTPPSRARVTDSARNWLRMSRRRAPSDLRMPIPPAPPFTLH